MKKDAYYFSHDANAQNDPKIIKLLYELDWKAYGLYWAIIERLRNEKDYTLERDYDVLAFALRTEADIVKAIIEDFDLFIICEKCFKSKSLNRRMEQMASIREVRSKAGKKGMKKRWGKVDNESITNTDEKHNKAITSSYQKYNNESKVKESKVKESKVKESKVKIREKYRAKPRDLEMVTDYFVEKKIPNPSDNAKLFYNHYEANGWYRGKTKIRSWRHCISAWEFSAKHSPLYKRGFDERAFGIK